MADPRVVRTDLVDGVAYPPARTGLRGSHPGSYDTAHSIRDGERFEIDDLPVEEAVDAVVVGAGMSGLAAAWFYRELRPDDRLLILDNHDDFGGLDRELYPSLGLSRGVFFTREAFGEDRLVTGDPMRMVADDIAPDRMNERPVEGFIGEFPVSEDSKARLIELFTSDRDALEGMSADEKVALLRRTSYRDFVVKYWACPTRPPTRSSGARATSSRGRRTRSRRSS